MNIGDMVEQDTRRFACPLSVPVEVPGDSTREHLINKGKKGRERTARSDETHPRVPNMVAVKILARAAPVRFYEFDKVDGRGGNGH